MHVDAEVDGEKRMCPLFGKVGGNVAVQATGTEGMA